MAVRLADSIAVTVTAPAVTVWLSKYAVAPPRRSFRVTAPAKPIESELLNGLSFTVSDVDDNVIVAVKEISSVADTVALPALTD